MSLTLQSVSVSYQTKKVLSEVNLEIRPGEILALIGPNGAGKSTLVRAISGVLPHTQGQISYQNRDISRLAVKERARLMAVVPQAREMPGTFTVYQAVLLGRTPYLNFIGQINQNDHEHVLEALQKTGISEHSERRINELSGGEQQRVLLARALAQDTPVLLMDEPTTHLDLKYQSSLLNTIRELCRERRLIVLLVLHDINLASIYADRVALLNGGGIYAQGKPSDVLTESNLRWIYQVPVNVITHPIYGTPLVLPDGIES